MNNKHDLDNLETFSPTKYPAIPLDADVKYGARLLAEKAEVLSAEILNSPINN